MASKTHGSLENATRRAIVTLAQADRRVREGELEIDDNAAVSQSSDNGAYVQAWMWVDFGGTSLDKESSNTEEIAEVS